MSDIVKQPKKQIENEVVHTEVENSSMPKFIDEKKARRIEAEKKWKAEREKKSKLVMGKFLFNECPGGELKFPFREFPGDEVKVYALKHDTVYQLPLGVAMHLNDRCSYDEYQHNLDTGKSIDAQRMYITTKIHRTNFIPLDWSVDVGNTSGKSVAEVTYTNPLDNRFNLDATVR